MLKDEEILNRLPIPLKNFLIAENMADEILKKEGKVLKVKGKKIIFPV